AIDTWAHPHTIRSFLGFKNFYRQFIPNYAEVVLAVERLAEAGSKEKHRTKNQRAVEVFVLKPGQKRVRTTARGLSKDIGHTIIVYVG
ncbi:hypothetical protein K470DRAFT_219550, partial [Piedraia hortae CBS 480.64]